MTEHDKKKTVFMRYGSLTNFRRIRMGHAAIGKRLKIGESTIRHFLKAFIAKGCSFQRLGHSARTRFSMFDADTRRILLSEEILEAWMPFSCKERVELIARMWDIRTTGKTLAKFYRENDIRFKSTKQAYKRAIENRDELEEERREFAVTLGNVLHQNRPIIYLDESSFINQAILPRSWAGAGRHQQYPIDSERFSTTVFGAIGNCLVEPVYKCYETTNKENVVDFLKLVASKVRIATKGKPFLLYDQHRAHTSHLARPVIDQYFVGMKQVPYSCGFNSIEKIWFVAKRMLLKRLILFPDLTQESFEAEVLKICKGIPDETVRGLLSSNHAYLCQYLAQAAQQENGPHRGQRA